MNQKEYDDFIREEKRRHLEEVNKRRFFREFIDRRVTEIKYGNSAQMEIIQCQHDNCPECKGTFIKLDGLPCVHYLVCNCPKCSPVITCSNNVEGK